jgi:hypothetical protein
MTFDTPPPRRSGSGFHHPGVWITSPANVSKGSRRIGSGFHHPGVSGHPKSAPGSTEIRRRLDSGPSEPVKSLKKSPSSRSGWHKTAQPSKPPFAVAAR